MMQLYKHQFFTSHNGFCVSSMMLQQGTPRRVKGHPEQTNLIAYKNGAGSLIVDATFSSKLIPPGSLVHVQFAALGFPGGTVESGWWSVTKIGVDTYKATGIPAADSFLDIYNQTLQPDFIEQMELEWEFKVNGGTKILEAEGASSNPFYVTRGGEAGEYHTVIHTGCKAAKYQTTEENVFKEIWKKFESRSIYSVMVVNGAVVDNELLMYYGRASSDATIKPKLAIECDNWGIKNPSQFPSIAREFAGFDSNNKLIEPSTWFTRGLLEKSDGTCGAWQNFMVDVLAVQVIATTKLAIVTPSKSFKVLSTAIGQGNATPKESIWGDHFVVQYGNDIYDPSYGEEYGNKIIAISEFVRISAESVGTIRLPALNEDTQGYGRVYEAQMGPININDFTWAFV